jgi:hypothetical protein
MVESFGNYCYESTRTWWTTKDEQGYHHLPHTTAVPWGGIQPEIANLAWAPHPQLSSYLLLPCTKAEINLK